MHDPGKYDSTEEFTPKQDGDGYWVPLYSVMKHQDSVRELSRLAALAKRNPKLLIDWIAEMGDREFERANLWKLLAPAFKFAASRASKFRGVQGGDSYSPRAQYITVEGFLCSTDAVEMKLRFMRDGNERD